jgi:membrane-bound lytic murein transglycosylase D
MVIRIPTVKVIGPIALLILFCSCQALAAQDPFPHFEVIEPNVSFWKQVYTKYATTQAIVHDSIQPEIQYEIIELVPYDAPGARKINQKRMKRAKSRYQGLLKRLAGDPTINNAACQRVAELFGPDADAKTFSRARHRIRCQIGQKDRFAQGLIRSGAHIDTIRAIFKSYGLPEDLAYLPHVESSFNTKAYSKFGAAGIWQFTRSTGKRFMKVDYVLDERRDPIRASHAAAQLLKGNYQKLGSWPLAITAYNHGAAGMKRAKDEYGNYPAIFQSYSSRSFKFASRNFYSEFLAARQVAADPTTFFGTLDLDIPLFTHAVPLDGYALFADLSTHFNLSLERLKELNPALRQPVYEGQKFVPKGYTLQIPAASQTTDMTLAAIPASLYKEKQKPSSFYTVQRGDTAGRIARTNGIDLSDLILANNLSRRATIFPRQTLRIPLPGEAALARKQPPVATPPPVLLAAKDVPDPVTAPVATIEEEVQTYPAPVLASIIPMPRPQAVGDAPAKPSAQIPRAEVLIAEVGIEQTHLYNGRTVGIIQVEVEETLGHYAEWANVPTWQIRRLNNLTYGRTLRLHQKVKIPVDVVSAPEFAQTRYEYHKRLQEDFFAAFRISGLQPYRIQRGDNYWTLCRDKFDIPMWLLRHCNPDIDFAELRISQRLMVPAVEKISAPDSEMDSTEKEQQPAMDQSEG